MRFYIRNKTKYDPSLAFTNDTIAIDVDRTQEISKIKEEARKVARGCKIAALYLAQADGTYRDLADDRTINYYELQDGTILETTSNPFWVTTLYSNMRRREQEAAQNPEDSKLCKLVQSSLIHRCMAIGLLFNGSGENDRQPVTFDNVDDLHEYCLTKGKKPAYMSQFTLDEIQEMRDDFLENFQHHRDPSGSFIHSQAVKLGYVPENDQERDASDPFRPKDGRQENHTGRMQRDAPIRQCIGGRERDAIDREAGRGNNNRGGAVGRGGRRKAPANRTCDDCEVAAASLYCPDCTPPLCLCDACWRSLHRGVTRRNHQMKDIAEAPRLSTYVPQAYKAPFAMLVAFHRASQERPQKLSLTAEEIKSRAQPFTDTDLETAKQRGKPFSGFDSLENALIKNDLVLKEAARTPKYSLRESGQGLASKCSNFDYAVQTLLQQAATPTVPIPAVRPVFRNRQVCLVVDQEEPLKDRFIRVARQRGLSTRTRRLPTGDFCWILLPPGANADTARDMPDQELVLPYLVERKTWDDLWSSVRTTRFATQVQKMKKCGIVNLFYLVEGSPKDIYGRPGPEVEAFLQGKLDQLLLDDKFFVNRTPSWMKTVEWLCHLTNLATEYQQSATGEKWMTYSEFARLNHRKNVDVEQLLPVQVRSVIWSASDFAENIRRHHTEQRALRDVQDLSNTACDNRSSLLVIQGLTAYNTNSQSLMKKALVDYLRTPGQTAEECVTRHLEQATDQLISTNVFQYYILYLEVFKGLRIYRTEIQQETQEILSKFENKEDTTYERIKEPSDDNDTEGPAKFPEERMNDLMFANDSQEEQLMLNQALQESINTDNALDIEGVPYVSDINAGLGANGFNPDRHFGPVIDDDFDPFVDDMNDTQDADDNLYDNGPARTSLDSMSEEEQVAFALRLSASQNSDSSNFHQPSAASSPPVLSLISRPTTGFTSRPVTSTITRPVPSTDSHPFRSTSTTSTENAPSSPPPSQEGTGKQIVKCEFTSGDIVDEEETARRALEESQLKLKKMLANDAMSKELEGGVGSEGIGNRKDNNAQDNKNTLEEKNDTCENEDEQLRKILEESKRLYELQNTRETKSCKNSDEDKELRRVLQMSLMDCGEQTKDSCLTYKPPRMDFNTTAAETSSYLDADSTDPVVIDSQDAYDDGSKDYEIAMRLQDELNKEASKSQVNNILSSRYDDVTDCILVDSQECDDVENKDYEVAVKLQEEYNNKGKKSTPMDSNNNDIVHDSSPVKTNSLDQLYSYRAQQQQRFHESKGGRKERLPPGLAFRRQAEAIAQGKSPLLGVVSPVGRNRDRRPEKRRFSDISKAVSSGCAGVTTARPGGTTKSCSSKSNSTASNMGSRGGAGALIFTGSSPSPRCSVSDHTLDLTRGLDSGSSTKTPSHMGGRGGAGALVFTGSTPSPRCSVSDCTPKRTKGLESSSSTKTPTHMGGKGAGVLVFPGSFQSQSPRAPPSDRSGHLAFSHSSSSSSRSGSATEFVRSEPLPSDNTPDYVKPSHTTQAPSGPKCSECGQHGHRKGTKKCPYYYSEAAQRKREEQVRKRKEERDEEDRQLQTRMDTLVAERVHMEEDSEQIRIQLDRFNRRYGNLPRIVEDAVSCIKRRRRR